MNANNNIKRIAKFTLEYLEKSFGKREDKEKLKPFLFGVDYRWQHTLRVAQFGKVIAESEGADVELVVAACLLHDIAWFDVRGEKSQEHGIIGGEISRPFLLELGYSPHRSRRSVMRFHLMWVLKIFSPLKQR